MKVFMLNGSPHRDGCIVTAMKEMGKVFDAENIQWEIYNIPHTPVRGCMACGKCSDGHCVFDDDCANEIIDKMTEADAIIIGSPVYYSGVNGTLKALLDRVFYAAGRNFAYKPAAAIVSCRRGGASSTYDQLNHYFGISQMIQVGSQYWNNIHGNNKEEALKDLEGLQIMRTLARNTAWIMKNTDGKEKPVSDEKRVSTNFIR
ncbi:MAG: flavodoxin family protein [Eubacteriaceae bacterium]|nr:flavodoxin family protein [Eubacteriaceae bacterium]